MSLNFLVTKKHPINHDIHLPVGISPPHDTSVGVPIIRTLRPIYEKTLPGRLAFHGP